MRLQIGLPGMGKDEQLSVCRSIIALSLASPSQGNAAAALTKTKLQARVNSDVDSADGDNTFEARQLEDRMVESWHVESWWKAQLAPPHNLSNNK